MAFSKAKASLRNLPINIDFPVDPLVFCMQQGGLFGRVHGQRLHQQLSENLWSDLHRGRRLLCLDCNHLSVCQWPLQNLLGQGLWPQRLPGECKAKMAIVDTFLAISASLSVLSLSHHRTGRRCFLLLCRHSSPALWLAWFKVVANSCFVSTIMFVLFVSESSMPSGSLVYTVFFLEFTLAWPLLQCRPLVLSTTRATMAWFGLKTW